MKTELLRSYSSNNLSSLSRTSSKISLTLNQTGESVPNTTLSSNDGKPDINLNITGNDDPTDEQQNDEVCCAQKLCSVKDIKKALPILTWLPHYTVEKLLSDIVAGITIALTLLPQGLAYASLAGLPPQYGLYSSFAGCFAYIFLGSTKDITIGPTAVLSIMTLSYSAGKPPEYGVMLSMLTGIMTFCMGMFRLGFIVNFISAPVNSAFTSAAAITICSTQIKALFGLKYHSDGFISIFLGVVEHVSNIRLSDTVLSAGCMVALLFLQNMPQIFSSWTKSCFKVQRALWLLSVARNAIVIVLCTAFFTILGRDETPVRVVGNITSGLPSFQPPPFSFIDPTSNVTHTFWELLKQDGSAIIVMPLLAIMEHITIAKAFAGTSRVDASQEMISIGVSNIIGTFFSSMTVTGSFSRTTVNNASGVQTPMGGLFTGIMVLLSLQFLTPYFYFIPKASLASVIVCAVISMVDFSVLYPMWKTKKMDLLPWTVTFVVSVLVGLEFGILTGLVISIVFLLYYAARPGVRVSKGELPSGAQFIMVSTDRSLVFPAMEYTRYIITKSSDVWGKGQLPVVIDCQHIQYADFTAALGIRDLFKLFNEKKQKLILWKIKPSIVRILTQVMEVTNEPFEHCSTEAELEACLLHAQVEMNMETPDNNRERQGKAQFSCSNSTTPTPRDDNRNGSTQKPPTCPRLTQVVTDRRKGNKDNDKKIGQSAK